MPNSNNNRLSVDVSKKLNAVCENKLAKQKMLRVGELQSGQFSSKANQVNIRTYTLKPFVQTNGIVYFFHGVHEHTGRYYDLFIQLAGKCLEVRAMDMVGHGQSEGLSGYFEKLSDVVDDALQFVNESQNCESSTGKKIPVILAGQGLGAAIAFFVAQQLPFKVDGLFFCSPCFRVSPQFHAVMQKLTQVSSLGSKLTPKLPSISVNFNDYCHSQKAVDDLRSDPLVCNHAIRIRVGKEVQKINKLITPMYSNFLFPFLVVHGTSDRMSDFNEAEKMYQQSNSTDKTFKKYEGGYHDLLHDYGAELTIKDITNWAVTVTTKAKEATVSTSIDIICTNNNDNNNSNNNSCDYSNDNNSNNNNRDSISSISSLISNSGPGSLPTGFGSSSNLAVPFIPLSKSLSNEALAKHESNTSGSELLPRPRGRNVRDNSSA